MFTALNADFWCVHVVFLVRCKLRKWFLVLFIFNGTELDGNPEANSSMKSLVCIEAGDSQGEVDKTNDKCDSNSEGM